jgi:hypothetical protein
MRIALSCTTLLLASLYATADQAPIAIDGVFGDWANVDAASIDPTGDAGSGSIDFTSLSIADDNEFLFLRIEATADFDLSENNALRVYLDTDDNASTGYAIGGLGAELQWRLGELEGTFYHDGMQTAVYFTELGFRGQPTVTSSVFEIAFSKDAKPDSTNLLFTGPTIRVLIVDGTNGDVMPDAGSTLTYTFDIGSTPPVLERLFDRVQSDDLRIITHNVLNDRPFTGSHQAKFERLWSAVAPDILNLQEIYDHTPTQTRDLVASWLGGTWHAAGNNDCITVSRYPISGSWAIDGNLAVLIDTTPSIGTPMLCINAHMPCCDNDDGRQWESDAIVAFIRDAYQPGGTLSLGADVPVLICGDLNMVGLAQQVDTLVTGNIVHNDWYGDDAPPDPDGTAMHNTIGRLTEKRMGYTWRNDGGWYWPGHLDFMIYSDSNLSRQHDFIVCTTEMSATALSQNGLFSGDSQASDHLVFCVDFARPCLADIDGSNSVDVDDLISLIGQWGPCNDCNADLTHDGEVGADDLLMVLSAWGSCQ